MSSPRATSNDRIHTAGDPTIDDQRRFWDRWNIEARSPDRLNEWTVRRGDAILRAVDALALEGARIIDLGCGTGWLTERLAQYGAVTGIDLSEAATDAARRRNPRIEYIAGDLFETPLPRGHFDLVVSQDVVAHVVEQSRYVALAADLLKRHGHLVMTTTNRFVVERMDLPPQPPEHIERWLTMRGLRRLLAPCFEIVRATTIMPIGARGVLRIVNSPRLDAVFRALVSPARIEAAKERLGFGYNLLIVARKRE